MIDTQTWWRKGHGTYDALCKNACDWVWLFPHMRLYDYDGEDEIWEQLWAIKEGLA